MRRTSLVALWVAAVLALGAPAWAGKTVGEFEEPEPMSAEDVAAAKDRSRGNMDDYAPDLKNRPAPFPWKTVAFLGVILLAAVPFAVGYYRRTAGEMTGTSGRRPRA